MVTIAVRLAVRNLLRTRYQTILNIVRSFSMCARQTLPAYHTQDQTTFTLVTHKALKVTMEQEDLCESQTHALKHKTRRAL